MRTKRKDTQKKDPWESVGTKEIKEFFPVMWVVAMGNPYSKDYFYPTYRMFMGTDAQKQAEAEFASAEIMGQRPKIFSVRLDEWTLVK